VHWRYAGPSNPPGDEAARRAAFEITRKAIGYRMLQLLRLSMESMDDAAPQAALLDISRS